MIPFSLTNAPASFQGLMNDFFKAFLRKIILVFFDNILIYSQDMGQHICHLQSMLAVLQHHSLFSKKSKYMFPVLEINYLGYIISGNGVKVDPSKLQSKIDWPIPKTVKSLSGFLGLTGY